MLINVLEYLYQKVSPGPVAGGGLKLLEMGDKYCLEVFPLALWPGAD